MRVYIEIEPVGLSNVVPAAVMNVQAQDMGTVIQVSWDEFEVVNEERDGIVVKYVVEKKINDGNWSHMFDFEEEDWATGFFFYDIEREEGNTYNYRIKAVTSLSKETDWSKSAIVEIEEGEEVPDTPTGLTANAISSSQIDISWNASTGATSYKIERRVGSGSWNVLEESHTSTTYIDTDVLAETEYSYRVSATNSAGTSSASSIATVTSPPASSEVFNAPLLFAEIDIDNQNGIFTTWTPASENTVTADYYEFEKIEDDGSPSISGAFSGAGGTAKDSVVTAGKVYKYRCRGHHSVHGYTPWSDQVTINLIYLNREYDFTYPSPVQDVALGAAFVYFPEAYRKNPVSEFPVVLYCHGQGEKAGGTSPNFTKLAGGAGFTKELRGTSNEIPVIAVCPQVVGWGSFETAGMIDECMAAVINDFGLPLQHKYVLSGYSSGGNETWPFVRNHANTNVVGYIPFACRLYIPSGNTNVQDYLDRSLPTWIFHNMGDTSQEPTNHIGFLNTVFTLDPDNDFIRGTIYDLSGHDPVTRTINTLGGDVVEGYYPYKNAGNELYDWIADCFNIL